MKRTLFTTAITVLALSISTVNAAILIDEVMTREDQKKTGVYKLSYQQRMALEAWLNEYVVMKNQAAPTEASSRSLSINIDNGQKIMLSDNTLWEIDPKDISISSIWITPFPVKVVKSGNADYPFILVNINTGASVRARQIDNEEKNHSELTPPSNNAPTPPPMPPSTSPVPQSNP